MKSRRRFPSHFCPLLVTFVAVAQAAGGAEVFRCALPGAPTAYSQFPCAPDQNAAGAPTPTQERLPLGTAQLVKIPPLTEAQMRRLAQAERQTTARRKHLRSTRQRDLRAQARERRQRQQRCAAAQQQLISLAAQRRRGYTLREAGALAERERALRHEVNTTC